jgi:uncharacterized surface protein with fasciclin (FAS1) repeats
MKNLTKLLTLLIIVTFLSSCSDDNDPIVETNTIVDVAVNNNLTSLVAAVTKVNLGATLSGPGPFTVLAPTNDAFATFLSDNNFNSLDDVPNELLTQVLLNHVIDGNLQSTDLTTGYAMTKATSAASNTNMSIYINTTGGVTFNGISSVTTANVTADNGTVHVVDKVIGLPTVVTFAAADANFSILVDALTRESDFTYVLTLSSPNGTSPAPFTVFAPTNDAFVSLLSELGVSALGDIDRATLVSTLNTHVVAGVNVLDTGLSDGLLIETLGGNLTANITGGATLTDSKNRVSQIIATNVQANNGVIHAINKVVLE